MVKIRSYGRPLASPEWTKRLADLEEALDRTVSRAKRPLRVVRRFLSPTTCPSSPSFAMRASSTNSDWERAKDLFPGKPEDERDRAVGELRQLHELQKSGALSLSEFNMKKWDVLSRTK